MKKSRRYLVPFSATLFLALGFSVGSVVAQERMTDKDVQKTMENLKGDAKRFRSDFNSAVGKSTIRKTSREKDAKKLVEQFQKQTEGMLKHFKDKKKADAELATVLSSAGQIDKVLTETPMGGKVDGSWGRVKSELGLLAKAFNAPYPT